MEGYRRLSESLVSESKDRGAQMRNPVGGAEHASSETGVRRGGGRE